MRVEVRSVARWLAAGGILLASAALGDEPVSAELLEFLGAMSPEEGNVVVLLEESALWADLQQQRTDDESATDSGQSDRQRQTNDENP